MSRPAQALALIALAGCGSLDYPSTGPVPTAPTEIPFTPPPPPPAASVNPVIMQAFYWDVPQVTPAGSWWNHLGAKAPELAAAGISAVWIPPPYKGHVGQNDVGYGVYDRYDLGEFDQKGSVATRYGTLAELLAAIGALHGAGVRVYADIV